MENSILVSTKKVLGIMADYDSFDIDIITHINSTFAIVNQIGVGPDSAFSIEDENAEWQDLGLPDDQLNLLRTYLFLKVRVLFDPPENRFLIGSINSQIEEYETRLSYMRESALPLPPPPAEDEDVSEAAELFALDWGTAGADQG